MSWRRRLRAAVAFAGLALARPASAQQSPVVFDDSFGNPGDAPTLPFGTSGLDYRIDADRGAPMGNSALLHSFERFGIPSGSAATFLGPDSIDFVFARVTGGAPSQIDGLLRSQIPGSDLYLVNPAGVLFGRGARIDVPGSLSVSTANFLKFGSQRLEVVRGGAHPTLVTAPPEAFGFAGSHGSIEISAGNVVLAVPTGRRLSLVGQGIRIGEFGSASAATAPQLSAPGGVLDLVSVSGEGELPLLGRSAADLADFDHLGTLEIGAGADLLANSGGRLSLRGEDIHLGHNTTASLLTADNLLLSADNTSAGTGGSIDIAARSHLLLRNTQLRQRNQGTGTSQGIALDAPLIELYDRSEATASSIGSGRGGAISVRANELRIDNHSDAATSLLTSGFRSAASAGTGGALSFEISAPAQGAAARPHGGDPLSGRVAIGDRGRIESASSGTGAVGALALDTVHLELTRGGQIRMQAEGDARPGGDADVHASGSIRISGGNRSSIESRNFSNTKAPDLRVEAESIELDDGGGILSKSADPGHGDLGDVTVVAKRIDIGPEGEISSATQTTGRAGDVDVRADEWIHVRGTGQPDPTFPTGIFSRSQADRGVAGSVTIHTDGELTLRDGAGISTLGAIGDAGNVFIEARELLVASGSVIDSTSMTLGRGGDVSIVVRDWLRVEGADSRGRPSRIGALAFGSGDAGTLSLRAPELIVDGGLIATSTLGLADLPIVLVLNGVVTTTSPPGFRITIVARTQTTLEELPDLTLGEFDELTPNVTPSSLGSTDLRPIVAEEVAGLEVATLLDANALALIRETTAHDGAGGRIEIEAGRVQVVGGGEIDASSFSEGSAGAIRIRADRLDVSGEGSGIFVRPGPGGTVRPGPDGVRAAIDVDAPRIEVRHGGRIAIDSGAEALDLSRFLTAVEDQFLGELDQLPTLRNGPVEFQDVRLPNGTLLDIVGQSSGTFGVSLPSVVSAPDLLRNRAIASPDAGSMVLRTEQLRVSDAGAISANAIGGSGGDIFITAPGGLVLDGGTIEASVVGNGVSGGNVHIDAPDYIALKSDSSIRARAALDEESGAPVFGGAIELSTESFLGHAEQDLDASAEGGPQFQGVVEVRAPENDVESQVTPLAATYVDASSQLRPACAARAAGEGGSFTVVARRGLPSSPDDLLLAYEEIEPAPAIAAAGDAATSYAARAGSAFRGGRYGEAESAWRAAADALAASGGTPAQRSDALRGLAQSQQARGEWGASQVALEQALAELEGADDPARRAAALGQLGNTWLALGQPERAAAALDEAREVALRSGRPDVAARLENDRGNQQTLRGAHAEAVPSYEAAAELAARAGDREAQAIALSNAARAALEAGQGARAMALLEQARALTGELARGEVKLRAILHLARSFEHIAQSDASQRASGLRAAHALLTEAIPLAEATGDRRSLSQAQGQLGGLYLGERRFDEAAHLTRRARREAEAAEAPDLISRWHWQEGRIAWAQGRASDALLAYRRSLVLLGETRQETLAHYGASGFRQALAPVYFDFAEALLASASHLESAGRAVDATQLLLEARATVEELKAAELRDYFRDECVAEIEARTAELDQVLARTAGRAAVVYPIALPDRLELLVTLPSGLRRYSVPVASAELDATVHAFREALFKRIGAAYRPHAAKLYDWLVRPYADQLDAEKVETLVFVPDGALRTIPLAALHDGERFLVERRAVAITPGLSLVDPEPLHIAKGHLLLAGISEAVQGMPPLPQVSAELAEIQALYGGTLMLDQDFVAERFERELASGAPSIVHVASHAEFTGDPRTSFLLAYDQKLTLDRLAEVVSPAQYREAPLELLVLSACETASGDERAALGLAGAAIRAGARSALGSLWRIHDEAAKELIVEFYQALGAPGVSKARALQSAQLHMLEDPAFQHPFYWSPYLLISNWM